MGLLLCDLFVPGWHRLPMQGICILPLSYALQLGYQIVFLRSLLVPPFVLINLLEVRNQMGCLVIIQLVFPHPQQSAHTSKMREGM